MNKPDWKDAPKWANWLAQDKNGEWCWYEYEPLCDHIEWFLIVDGKYEKASTKGEYNPEWRNTLESRPTTHKEDVKQNAPKFGNWNTSGIPELNKLCLFHVNLVENSDFMILGYIPDEYLEGEYQGEIFDTSGDPTGILIKDVEKWAYFLE